MSSCAWHSLKVESNRVLKDPTPLSLSQWQNFFSTIFGHAEFQDSLNADRAWAQIMFRCKMSFFMCTET